VSFRLARGHHGPAASIPAPPTGGFNALTFAGAQGQRRLHAAPLACLGTMPRRCSANPPGEAIPATVRFCAVRPVSALRHYATHSCTVGVPHPRKRTVEPSKGDERLFCARMGPCRDVGRVPYITIIPVRPSPPLQRHPGHCSAIPGTAAPSRAL
jgi:hypothetical protein